MTKNNLKTHLSWLLNVKPFVPPAGHHIVLPTLDAPLSSGTLRPESLAANVLHPPREAPAREQPRSQPVAPEFRPHAPQDHPEAVTIPLQINDSESDTYHTTTDMARLRAAPGSASKSRLMSHGHLARTPLVGASNRLNNKLVDTSSGSSRWQKDPLDTERGLQQEWSKRKGCVETGTVRSGEWDVAGIDEIDLTGDSDNRTGSSPSVHVPASMSRKRRSDHFESELEGSPAARRPRIQGRDTVSLSSDEFPPIENFDPPPPYSTVAQNTILPVADPISLIHDEEFGDAQDTSVRETDDEGQLRVSESPFKSVPKKREPSSPASDRSERGLSAVTIRKASRSPKKVNWNTRDLPVEEERQSSINVSYQTKQRIIADSDSEDDFALGDQNIRKHSQFSPPRSQMDIEKQGNTVKPSASSHSAIDKSKDFRWHECKGDPLSLASQSKQAHETVTDQRLPQNLPDMQRASSILEKAVAISSSCQASPSLLTKRERQAVAEFASWPESFLHGICAELDSEVRRLKDEQTQYLEEYEIPSRDLVEKSKLTLKRKGVIEHLLETRYRFLEADLKKKELTQKVLSFMETDYSHDLTDFYETEAQMKAASEHSRTIETEMIQLMKAAGFVDGEGNSVRLCERQQASPASVVVRSTQAVPKKYPKEKQRFQGSADVLSTQRVQQTQIPPWSPKAAAQRDAESVLMRRNFRADPGQGDFRNFVEKDVDGIFSNSVPRYGRRDHSNDCQQPPKGNTRHDVIESRIQFDENDIEENDEALWDTNMGSPPTHHVDDDDEYGGFDFNDEDMLDMTEEMEMPKINGPSVRDRGSRNIFQETSGYHTHNQLGHETSIKKSRIRHSNLMGPPPANQPQYTWTSDVKKALRDKFHLRGFRPHQLEAINATLAGKDCFVLMPTGGGKSLCYQLPAVVQSGKTRGVTVVISPLLSLMEDQVNHLRALHVQAFHINGELSYDQRRVIMNALREPQVEKFIQVLYVTPEMLSKNQAMINLLQDLHRRQQLARMVIDEAHCVSQWGHDFRPDYKALGDVRRQFMGVPVMALTATATENVKVDTIHNLGIQGCEIFAQSFNRPNLYYEVRSKGKREDVLQSIADIIKTQYRGQSGIVYCLSRKKCEVIAQQLREKYNISAQHYHAGMEPAQKSETQKAWQAGRYKIIVATIAFGMGIDKPDVRFVIHHSIPKSLEGYYQETGRAGRDGKRSGCYLFYGYQDTTILKKMIDEGDGSQQQKDRQYAMLRNVVQFCENKADCRRVQVLAYFNESFKAEDCDGECDNCNSTTIFEHRDFTDLAAEAVSLVQKIHTDRITLLHCADVFRGASSKRIKELGHDCLDEYGIGSGLDRGDAERLFQRLVSEDALEEKNHVNRAGFTTQYIKLGRNFRIFQARERQIQIHVRVSPRKAKSSKAKTATTRRRGNGVATARDDYPLSTNVSSPIQVASRLKHGGRSVHQDDDDDGSAGSEAEDESEAFEPAPLPRSRMIAKSSKSSHQKLGLPITTDEKMARLDEVHQDVVEEFVLAGRSECQKILISRSLRAHPFTDTVLREMAISFPATQRELMEIPGIDHQMVTLYGERFLKLIRQFKNDFEAMKAPRSQQPDKVKDPNHEIIEISDEDDDEDKSNDEDEYEFDDEEEFRSLYFPQHVADPEVEAFNARFSQAQASAKPAAGPSGGGSTRPATGVHRYTPGKKSYSRKGPRRSSTGGYSRSRGGTSAAKKTTSKKREGGGASGSTKFSKKGGGGGPSVIGMMPT